MTPFIKLSNNSKNYIEFVIETSDIAGHYWRRKQYEAHQKVSLETRK